MYVYKSDIYIYIRTYIYKNISVSPKLAGVLNWNILFKMPISKTRLLFPNNLVSDFQNRFPPH